MSPESPMPRTSAFWSLALRTATPTTPHLTLVQALRQTHLWRYLRNNSQATGAKLAKMTTVPGLTLLCLKFLPANLICPPHRLWDTGQGR